MLDAVLVDVPSKRLLAVAAKPAFRALLTAW